jgi:excisionase family DNA binding protein
MNEAPHLYTAVSSGAGNGAATTRRRCRTAADRMPAPEATPLWTPTDAAAFLRIHEKTVVRLARQQAIPALRLGKHWRFRSEDLTAWAASKVAFTCQPERVMETSNV